MIDFNLDLPESAFADIDADGIGDGHDFAIDSDRDGMDDSVDTFVDSDGDWKADGQDEMVDRDGDWIDDRHDMLIDSDGDFVKDGLLTTTQNDSFLDAVPEAPIPTVEVQAALGNFGLPSPF